MHCHLSSKWHCGFGNKGKFTVAVSRNGSANPGIKESALSLSRGNALRIGKYRKVHCHLSPKWQCGSQNPSKCTVTFSRNSSATQQFNQLYCYLLPKWQCGSQNPSKRTVTFLRNGSANQQFKQLYCLLPPETHC